MNTTNYIPIIDESKCVGCGKCTLACPMTAIAEK
ncbi:MAG: 4Fe-4S binding protein [Clostridium sp.]